MGGNYLELRLGAYFVNREGDILAFVVFLEVHIPSYRRTSLYYRNTETPYGEYSPAFMNSRVNVFV